MRRFHQGGEAKYEAVNELLSSINRNMYNVTTMASDWTTLNAVSEEKEGETKVNTVRHILTGKEIQLTTEQKCKLDRNLVHGSVLVLGFHG